MATVRRSMDAMLVTLFMAGLGLVNSFYFVPSTVGRGALAAHGTSHPTTQAPITEPSQRWSRTGGSVAMMSKNHKGRRGPGMTNVQRVLNMREREANTNYPQKVMICNLDYSLTEEDIEKFCSNVGMVVAVKLIKKRDGKTSKGYAFVDFDLSISATIAIEDLTGQMLKGRRVEVKPAITTKEKVRRQKQAAWLEKQGRLEEERRAQEDGVPLEVESEVVAVEPAAESDEGAAEDAEVVAAVEEPAPVA